MPRARRRVQASVLVVMGQAHPVRVQPAVRDAQSIVQQAHLLVRQFRRGTIQPDVIPAVMHVRDKANVQQVIIVAVVCHMPVVRVSIVLQVHRRVQASVQVVMVPVQVRPVRHLV